MLSEFPHLKPSQDSSFNYMYSVFAEQMNKNNQ
uniref:Uncharacterized protein n=1 Tax=Arundo donax TaxID=35708 RepID=A0A0A8YYZ8_ARUDO